MTTRRHDDDDTARETITAKPEPAQPLPQHTQTQEEIDLLAEMDKAREANDANAYEDARKRWIEAVQKRAALGDTASLTK